MAFPIHRMRRLRRTERLRNMVRETRLSPDCMIYPIFVCPGERIQKEISSMPGQYTISVDHAVDVAREAEKLGVGAYSVGWPHAIIGFDRVQSLQFQALFQF